MLKLIFLVFFLFFIVMPFAIAVFMSVLGFIIRLEKTVKTHWIKKLSAVLKTLLITAIVVGIAVYFLLKWMGGWSIE